MADLIQKTDSLNDGRVKLNEAIKNADRAKWDAGQARQVAQAAEKKANSVQAQFDQVVIEGDSSVEAAQARVGANGDIHASLKARLDAEQEAAVQRGELLFNVRDFGAVPDGETDNTAVYDRMIADVPEGSKILFPKGTYVGNFVSNKAFNIDFQDSTLIPIGVSSAVKFEGDYSDRTRNVIGIPARGGNHIVVDDTNGIAEGNTVYLYDESIRTSDNTPTINVELLRVKKVENNTIQVYDMIRSRQNTGLVKLKKISTVKDPKVFNLRVENPSTNNDPVIYFKGCEGPVAENIEVKNSYGHAVRFENCLDYSAKKVKVDKPGATGSGEGYGVTSVKSRGGEVKEILGIGTRHAVDLMSSYNVFIEKVKEEGASHDVVVLSHNGYGGNIQVKDVIANTDGYAVSWSAQGVADLNKQTMEDVSIRNIEHIVPNKTPDETSVSIRLTLDYKNLEIDGVKTIFLKDSPITSDSSRIVRINGNPKGNVSIKNLYAKKVSIAIQAESRVSYIDYDFNFNIENIVIEESRNTIWLRGIFSANIRGVKYRVEPTDTLIKLDTFAGVTPTNINVSNDVDIPSGDKFIKGVSAIGLRGNLAKRTDTSTGGFTVEEGGKITQEKLLKSSGYLSVTTAAGSDTTLNAITPIDPPLWVGQEILLTVNGLGFTGTRGNLIIPGGTATYASDTPTTFVKGKIYRLIGYNGKWLAQS